MPIVGGDFDQEILAQVLDHELINQAAASLYRDRVDATPGVAEADFSASLSGAAVWDASTGTCSNLYCHGHSGEEEPICTSASSARGPADVTSDGQGSVA